MDEYEEMQADIRLRNLGNSRYEGYRCSTCGDRLPDAKLHDGCWLATKLQESALAALPRDVQ